MDFILENMDIIQMYIATITCFGKILLVIARSAHCCQVFDLSIKLDSAIL